MATTVEPPIDSHARERTLSIVTFTLSATRSILMSYLAVNRSFDFEDYSWSHRLACYL